MSYMKCCPFRLGLNVLTEIGAHNLVLPAPFAVGLLSLSLCEVYTICEITNDWWCVF